MQIPRINEVLDAVFDSKIVPPLTETTELWIGMPAIEPPVDKVLLRVSYCCLASAELLSKTVLMFPFTITEPDYIDERVIEL